MVHPIGTRVCAARGTGEVLGYIVPGVGEAPVPVGEDPFHVVGLPGEKMGLPGERIRVRGSRLRALPAPSDLAPRSPSLGDEERRRRSERMLRVQRVGADLARVRRKHLEKWAQP